ncbi:MAG: hypothetical protein M3Z36_02970, partial [Acidobacteriota bacterium]|nr:hypothetical protein [Acidobacteriota bacterium]
RCQRQKDDSHEPTGERSSRTLHLIHFNQTRPKIDRAQRRGLFGEQLHFNALPIEFRCRETV